VSSFFAASKAETPRRTTMPQLAVRFDAPTLNYDQKGWQEIAGAPEANWTSPSHRRLKMASLRGESSNQLLETLEEWNDYLER
jgi:hypothetical protein